MRRLAHGTKLKMGNGDTVPGPETFATVIQLTRVGMPNQTRAPVDTSDHDTEEYMEFEPAKLADGGTLAFEGHFDAAAASHGLSAGVGIVAAFQNGVKGNWQWVDPDGVLTISFAGFITAKGGDAPSEGGAGKLTMTGEIKISGKPVYAAPV